MVTPLVRKYKKGTFITFQSTGEDLTFTFNNSVNKFKFSKYALLEIPPIQDQVDGKNNIQFENVEGSFVDGLSPASPPPEGDRIDLSQSLQNYLLNIETLLIRSKDYDPDTKQTAAERLFFKWLKEIGAIRYRDATTDEKSSDVTDDRFAEELPNNLPSGGDLYTQVVKYIGELDVDGSHKTNTNAYKEVIFYIPTENGSTPTVMFKSVEDENYFAGQTIRKPTSDPNLEFIAGRDATDDPTSAGLDVSALYDMDVSLSSLDYDVNGGADPIWFESLAPNGPNAYFTDPVFGDSDSDLIIRTDPSTSKTITYKRSKLDGVMLDFAPDNYKSIKDNQDISTLNQFNTTDSARPFRFNAIAVYYDVFDPNNLDDDGNPIDSATNLYGILLLNELEVISGGASQIGYLDKLKPNKVIGEQGNGYGVKLNLKFDVSSDAVQETEVEITVDPFNTFSMELFMDTLQRVAQTNENFEKIVLDNVTLSERVEELEGLILNDANKQELLIKIEEINEVLVDVTPNSDLLDLINVNKDSIDQILLGNTSVDINFLLNLKAFDGLRLELINNELVFRNTRQEYDSTNEININTSQNQLAGVYNVLKLGSYTTLYYHKNNGGQKTLEDNLHIFIDDSTNKWKVNQSMKIIFVDEIDFQNFGIGIFTDANNEFNLTAPYNKLIGNILEVPNNKPIIEIICLDSTTYSFIVTIK